MAELKTQETDADPIAFVNAVENKRRREDSLVILELLKKISNRDPKMWGESLVGYGAYNYQQKSGQSGRWPIIGFSPRKSALVIYIMPGFKEFSEQMEKLGKFKNSVSCLYITRLANIDLDVLEDLMRQSVAVMKQRYDCE